MTATVTEVKMKATLRDQRGKNESGRIRRGGGTPGNLIYNGVSHPLVIETSDFQKMLQSGLRQSSIIDMEIDGAGIEKENRVIVKEIQRHPVNGSILHVDFYRVIPGKEVKVRISVETSGFCKGVKAGGALEQYIRTLNVRTVPEALLEKVDVDITNLDVGEAIHLNDLKLPEKWEVITKGNPIICRVARSRLTATAPTEEPEAKK